MNKNYNEIHLNTDSKTKVFKSFVPREFHDKEILEIDNKGILAKKDFYNVNDMKNLKFDTQRSETLEKRNFIYNFLSSLRQKANDPLGVRKRKREQGSGN